MGPRLSPVTPAWQSPSTPRPSIRVIEDVGSLLKLCDVERETLRTDIVSCEGGNTNYNSMRCKGEVKVFRDDPVLSTL